MTTAVTAVTTAVILKARNYDEDGGVILHDHTIVVQVSADADDTWASIRSESVGRRAATQGVGSRSGLGSRPEGRLMTVSNITDAPSSTPSSTPSSVEITGSRDAVLRDVRVNLSQFNDTRYLLSVYTAHTQWQLHLDQAGVDELAVMFVAMSKVGL